MTIISPLDLLVILEGLVVAQNIYSEVVCMKNHMLTLVLVYDLIGCLMMSSTIKAVVMVK